MEKQNEQNIEIENAMKLRKEIVTLGEAREVERSIKGFLDKGWNKRDPKDKITNYYVIIGEQIKPLKEINRNLEEYKDLVKRTKEESLTYISDDLYKFTECSGFEARKTRKGIELAKLHNSVGSHNCLAQKIVPHKSFFHGPGIKVITDFEIEKGYNDATFYGFNLSEDVRKIIDDSSLCEIISNVNSESCLPIGGVSSTPDRMYMEVKGKLTNEWVPLALKLDSSNGGFSFATPSDDDYLVIQYPENMSLEKTLIKDYLKPESLGNGIKVYSESNVPKYLQRKLGL